MFVSSLDTAYFVCIHVTHDCICVRFSPYFPYVACRWGMDMNDITSLRVTRDTMSRLSRLGSKDDSFEIIIQRLINFYLTGFFARARWVFVLSLICLFRTTFFPAAIFPILQISFLVSRVANLIWGLRLLALNTIVIIFKGDYKPIDKGSGRV